MRILQPTEPQIVLAVSCSVAIAAPLAASLTFGSLPAALGSGLSLGAFIVGVFFGKRGAIKVRRAGVVPLHGSLSEETFPGGPVEPAAPPFDRGSLDDNIIPLESKRPSKAAVLNQSAAGMELASVQLGEYPAYVDLLTLQLQSISTVSQDAAENLLTSLLEVDRRVTALMEFLQNTGSNDSSERILGRIEDQLSGCRTHLSNLSQQQERAAADAVASQRKLAEETQDVLGVLSGVQRMSRQTTMLSLNVSIEAARVGDLGKGFAVIAQEIRSLAGEVQQLADNVHDRVSGLMSSVQIDLQEQANQRKGYETTAMSNVSDALGLLTTNLVLLLQHQREVLGRIKSENEDIAEPIMSMMGRIQFQDIVRQQIEQVITMAVEVKTHMGAVKDGLQDPETLAGIEMLTERLDKLSASYVMREQRDMHGAVLGQRSPAEAAVASIELF